MGFKGLDEAGSGNRVPEQRGIKKVTFYFERALLYFESMLCKLKVNFCTWKVYVCTLKIYFGTLPQCLLQGALI